MASWVFLVIGLPFLLGFFEEVDVDGLDRVLGARPSFTSSL